MTELHYSHSQGGLGENFTLCILDFCVPIILLDLCGYINLKLLAKIKFLMKRFNIKEISSECSAFIAPEIQILG